MKFLIVLLATIGFSATSMAGSTLNCDHVVLLNSNSQLVVGFAPLQIFEDTPDAYKGKIIKTMVGGFGEFSTITDVVKFGEETENGEKAELLVVKVQLGENIKAENRSPRALCKLYRDAGI